MMDCMKMIKSLLFEIDDETDGAMDYVRNAVDLKEEWPDMSEMYAEMAEEEMGHIERLQEAVDHAADRMARNNPDSEGVMEMIQVIRERDDKRVEGLRSWLEKAR